MPDEWTAVHFAICLALAAYWTVFAKDRWWGSLLTVTIIAVVAGYGWEFAERALEETETGASLGPAETWWNSWIVDPITDVLGAVVGWWLVRRWQRRNGVV